MSTIERKPILHGRDHCPGGADPIPCMISGPSGDYETTVLATSDLLAYWRLGEMGEPWADTSGTEPPADLSLEDSGLALTPDVTGGLPAGQDDGAVQFNYEGTADSGGEYLGSGAPTPNTRFQLNHMTVAAFVKLREPAGTPASRGQIAGSIAWASGPDRYSGWALQAYQLTGQVTFTRGGEPGVNEDYALSPGALIYDEWYHVTGTYDGAEIKLYLNGVLADTTADTSDDTRGQTSGVDMGYLDVTSTNLWLVGSVDEVAVWSRALTQAEISALYSSGLGGTSSGSQVLLSDGEGGTYWGQAGGAAIEDEAIVDRHVATGADIDPLKIEHPGGTSTFLRADGTWAAAGGSDPADDTLVWMPLVDSDGTCVLDAGDNLIPTLIPI